MPIRKGNYQDKYTTLPNATARDTRLSLMARGLLLYLVSLPGDWKISRKQVAKDNAVNDKTIQKYINELKDNGYIFYVKSREKGTFSGGDYYVYPEPQNEHQKSIDTADTKGFTVDPNFGRPVNAAAGRVVHIQKKELNKRKNSELVNSRNDEIFQNRVIMALTQDGLNEVSLEGVRYAEMKITEYCERFPSNLSVADCWSYVVQALKHRESLIGSM